MEDVKIVEEFLRPSPTGTAGYGDGSGSGDGSGIMEIEGRKVYMIDSTQTVIYAVRGDVAKAAVLKHNVDFVPCYVARVGGHFAHGETAEEALRDAEAKYMADLPPEQRVELALAEHPDPDAPVPCRELFALHGMLTGSCEFGRRKFCEDHLVDMDGSMTLREFCSLTRDAFGGEVVRMLEAALGDGNTARQ